MLSTITTISVMLISLFLSVKLVSPLSLPLLEPLGFSSFSTTIWMQSSWLPINATSFHCVSLRSCWFLHCIFHFDGDASNTNKISHRTCIHWNFICVAHYLSCIHVIAFNFDKWFRWRNINQCKIWTEFCHDVVAWHVFRWHAKISHCILPHTITSFFSWLTKQWHCGEESLLLFFLCIVIIPHDALQGIFCLNFCVWVQAEDWLHQSCSDCVQQ